MLPNPANLHATACFKAYSFLIEEGFKINKQEIDALFPSGSKPSYMLSIHYPGEVAELFLRNDQNRLACDAALFNSAYLKFREEAAGQNIVTGEQVQSWIIQMEDLIAKGTRDIQAFTQQNPAGTAVEQELRNQIAQLTEQNGTVVAFNQALLFQRAQFVAQNLIDITQKNELHFQVGRLAEQNARDTAEKQTLRDQVASLTEQNEAVTATIKKMTDKIFALTEQNSEFAKKNQSIENYFELPQQEEQSRQDIIKENDAVFKTVNIAFQKDSRKVLATSESAGRSFIEQERYTFDNLQKAFKDNAELQQYEAQSRQEMIKENAETFKSVNIVFQKDSRKVLETSESAARRRLIEQKRYTFDNLQKAFKDNAELQQHEAQSRQDITKNNNEKFKSLTLAFKKGLKKTLLNSESDKRQFIEQESVEAFDQLQKELENLNSSMYLNALKKFALGLVHTTITDNYALFLFNIIKDKVFYDLKNEIPENQQKFGYFLEIMHLMHLIKVLGARITLDLPHGHPFMSNVTTILTAINTKLIFFKTKDLDIYNKCAQYQLFKMFCNLFRCQNIFDEEKTNILKKMMAPSMAISAERDVLFAKLPTLFNILFELFKTTEFQRKVTNDKSSTLLGEGLLLILPFVIDKINSTERLAFIHTNLEYAADHKLVILLEVLSHVAGKYFPYTEIFPNNNKNIYLKACQNPYHPVMQRLTSLQQPDVIKRAFAIYFKNKNYPMLDYFNQLNVGINDVNQSYLTTAIAEKDELMIRILLKRADIEPAGITSPTSSQAAAEASAVKPTKR